MYVFCVMLYEDNKNNKTINQTLYSALITTEEFQCDKSQYFRAAVPIIIM